MYGYATGLTTPSYVTDYKNRLAPTIQGVAVDVNRSKSPSDLHMPYWQSYWQRWIDLLQTAPTWFNADDQIDAAKRIETELPTWRAWAHGSSAAAGQAFDDADARGLQWTLNALVDADVLSVHPIEETGIFDTPTQMALLAFQRDWGIPMTGTPDSLTNESLAQALWSIGYNS